MGENCPSMRNIRGQPLSLAICPLSYDAARTPTSSRPSIRSISPSVTQMALSSGLLRAKAFGSRLGTRCSPALRASTARAATRPGASRPVSRCAW
jgi:hypothetical protein